MKGKCGEWYVQENIVDWAPWNLMKNITWHLYITITGGWSW
jgi:hypothetical protein